MDTTRGRGDASRPSTALKTGKRLAFLPWQAEATPACHPEARFEPKGLGQGAVSATNDCVA